jgi:hypothetical protein
MDEKCYGFNKFLIFHARGNRTISVVFDGEHLLYTLGFQKDLMITIVKWNQLTRLERTISYRTNNLGRFKKIEAGEEKHKLGWRRKNRAEARGGEQSFIGEEE